MAKAPDVPFLFLKIEWLSFSLCLFLEYLFRTGETEELGFVELLKKRERKFVKSDRSKEESDVLSWEVSLDELKISHGLGIGDGLKGIGVGQKAVVSMG